MATATEALTKFAEELAKVAGSFGEFSPESTVAHAAELRKAMNDSLQNIHRLCEKGVAAAESVSAQSVLHSKEISELKATTLATAELLRGLSASVNRQTRIASLQWAYDHVSQISPSIPAFDSEVRGECQLRREVKTKLVEAIIQTAMAGSGGHKLPGHWGMSPSEWRVGANWTTLMRDELQSEFVQAATAKFREAVKGSLSAFTGLHFALRQAVDGQYEIYLNE